MQSSSREQLRDSSLKRSVRMVGDKAVYTAVLHILRIVIGRTEITGKTA